MKSKIFTLFLLMSSVIAFGQGTCCLVPVQPYSNNATQHTVSIHWYYPGLSTCPNPIGFQIRYHSANIAAWQHVNVPFTSNGNYLKMLTNLTANTVYTWQIRTGCVNPNGQYYFSSWSPLQTFITLQRTGETSSGDVLFNLYPNPVNDAFYLDVSGVDADLSIHIVNFIGQTMMSETIPAADISAGEAIDVSQFPSGNYFVMLNWSNYQQVMKMVKE